LLWSIFEPFIVKYLIISGLEKISINSIDPDQLNLIYQKN